ncbi:DNA-binding MarR family transcriptional regulator [Motilibacter rhizosphaerae]|uniref:DNA-binding MarR family transcriptional regulator n=1 Tax=Motilibacter rhizosphaerae TaxID=598652 RepID=A0A4Q7NWZ7_9ACTN|nr:MarR family transcriptional regulator [Motilibacter rhizosphaerae]RZS91734.1 DNA-binding MarR family transcriptional regulator [Motilibacter rhizosphaerae]
MPPQPEEPELLAEEIHRAGESLAVLWLRQYDTSDQRVSPSQMRALLVVQRQGRVTMTELAEELDAMVSSASRLTDRLVSAGYVVRAADAARPRVVLLELTPDGRRLLDEHAARRRRTLVAALAQMTPAERRALRQGLGALDAALGAPRPEGSRAAQEG